MELYRRDSSKMSVGISGDGGFVHWKDLILILNRQAEVAQLLEHLISDQKIAGSNQVYYKEKCTRLSPGANVIKLFTAPIYEFSK